MFEIPLYCFLRFRLRYESIGCSALLELGPLCLLFFLFRVLCRISLSKLWRLDPVPPKRMAGLFGRFSWFVIELSPLTLSFLIWDTTLWLFNLPWFGTGPDINGPRLVPWILLYLGFGIGILPTTGEWPITRGLLWGITLYFFGGLQW